MVEVLERVLGLGVVGVFRHFDGSFLGRTLPLSGGEGRMWCLGEGGSQALGQGLGQGIERVMVLMLMLMLMLMLVGEGMRLGVDDAVRGEGV